MPTYEYRCPEGHEFEQFVLKISAAKSELACPTCGLVAPRRMSAGGGLLFKGSGFYITDYGKDGKKAQPTAASVKAGSGSAEGKGGSGEPAGASSESKSASSESKGGASGAPAAKEPSAASGASSSQKSAPSDKSATPASAPKSGPAK
jgi:putative FmdB family regulatory protein